MNLFAQELGDLSGQDLAQVVERLAAFLPYLQENTDYQLSQAGRRLDGAEEQTAALERRLNALAERVKSLEGDEKTAKEG